MTFDISRRKTMAARFSDGKSARSYSVQVKIESEKFVFKLSDDQNAKVRQEHWPGDRIRTVDDADSGAAVTFTNVDIPMSRLVFSSPDEARMARETLDIKPEHSLRVGLGTWSLVGWFAVAAATLTAAVLAAPALSSLAAPYVPQSWRAQLGQFVTDILTEGKAVCVGEPGQQALESIVRKLSEGQALEQPLTVEVIDFGQVNAFAAPGGMIVIFSELIDQAESAEEVAGVVAHEIGHVVENHPTAGAIRSLGLSLAVQVMLGGGDAGGAASTALGLYDLSYSRKDELEADRLAGQMLLAADVDPGHLNSFFNRMSEGGSGLDNTPLKYLSSHPAWSDRIAAVSSLEKPDRERPILTAAQWRGLRNICSGAGAN